MKNKILFLSFLSFFTLLICNGVHADCESGPDLQNENLYFYEHDLGVYTIHLSPTLTAIQNHQAGEEYPYYKKPWLGSCPNGLGVDNEECIEFTVYPDLDNFDPNPMTEIEKYTNGTPNRGEVRVITNADQTRYVYTIDHEKTFCGPYEIK